MAQTANVMIAPLVADIADHFSVSIAVAGQLATATFAAWAVSAVLVSPLSDSFGRRPVTLVGLTLVAVSLIASAFSPNLETLMALRAITGLSGGMLPPNVMATVADVISPAKRAQTVGIMMGVVMLSGIVTLPLFALAAEWGGWDLPFLLSGVALGAAAGLNWLWFPKDDRQKARQFSFFSRYRSLLSMGFFRAAVAVNATHRIGYWGLYSYFAAYLIEVYGLSVGEVALPVALTGVGQVVGSASAGLVANRSTRAFLLAGTFVAGGVCGLVFFFFRLDLWAAVAVAAVGIGLLNLGFPVLVALTTVVAGESRATGIGMMALSNQIGGIGGAALAGLLLNYLGFGAIGYLCFGVTLLAGLLVTVFMRSIPSLGTE